MSVSASPEMESIENHHILLVDDDLAFLTLVEAVLKALGVKRISRAASGRDVYNHFRKSIEVVDCIISDYSMAEGNGLQLLHAIRTGLVPNVRPDICFVLLTASGDETTVATAKRLDVSSYLVKPVTPAKLLETIAKARSRAIKIDIPRYKQVAVPGP
jgi:CheY-like chemotaxis protein